MNRDILKGNWTELKGKVRERWGELTDDEIDQIAGERDQLVGVLQKHYGYAKEEAEKEVEDWSETPDFGTPRDFER